MDLFSTKIAYAAFDDFLAKVNSQIINPLILFLFALAVVYFLWGMLGFFLNSENEEAKTTGKNHMIWGVVGITIMLGVWTILNIIINTLNIEGIEIKQNQNQGEIKIDLPKDTPQQGNQ